MKKTKQTKKVDVPHAMYQALLQALPPLQTMRDEYAVWGSVGGKQVRVLRGIIMQVQTAMKAYERSVETT